MQKLLKWWLFLLAINAIQGLEELWETNNYVVNHRIMKRILDSCYKNDSAANPTLIFGDFREFIVKSSVIWLNQSFRSDIKRDVLNRTDYHPNKIIIIGDSPKQLAFDLHLLSRTRWWNPMASFFFVEKNNNTCDNARSMLMSSWRMNILNSIYICSKSGEEGLITFNPLANYAPLPWKMIEGSKHDKFFYQYFDSEISCKNLHYDKTIIIREYEMKIVAPGSNRIIPGEYPFEKTVSRFPYSLQFKLLNYVLKSLNVTGKLIITKNQDAMNSLLRNFSADMSATGFGKFRRSSRLILYPEWEEMIAVIKLGPEISTLTKIRQLWDMPVLITAAVAIGILFIVLTILHHDFSLAILDLTRLLTYTSVLINNRSHEFRIYFTTMLIFMVISNGVFQGSISAFLTKQEKESPVATLDKLIEMKYKMYSGWKQKSMTKYICPKCDIEETSYHQCIQFVLNGSRNTCLIQKRHFETLFNLMPLDYVRITTMLPSSFFISRPYYPLRNHIRKTIMRIFESGLMEMWKNNLTYRQKKIRQAMEAEWSSPQYKPVKLYKLIFAFQVLALGLSISTIVFLLELVMARYSKFCRIK